MSQNTRIANHDLREYVDVHAMSAFAGNLTSLNEDNAAMWALSLLLAASNGKASGDFDPVPERVEGNPDDGFTVIEPPEHVQTLLKLVGRWAGNRVSIIGSYFAADTEIEYSLGEPGDLWQKMTDQDGWVDISEHVIELIELDESVKAERHEPEAAPSGATWTMARGFAHARELPVSPRSILNPDGTIEAIPALPEIDPLELPVEATPLDPARLDELEAQLDRARNAFGPLDEEIRRHIRDAALHPNSMTWDAARTLNITGSFSGLWSAVCEIDPSFPRSVPSPEVGEVQWPKVPSGETILLALQATLKTT
jgi:hypothetical protein